MIKRRRDQAGGPTRPFNREPKILRRSRGFDEHCLAGKTNPITRRVSLANLPTKAACSGSNPSCFPKTVLENHPPAKGVVHVDPQDDV